MKLLKVILFMPFIWAINVHAQADGQQIKNNVLFNYGNKAYMCLHTNKKILTIKDGLPDGKYIAFYSDNLRKLGKDTALVVYIYKGKVEGLLRRWDDEDHTLLEECEYKNGLMNGYRRLYFTAPDKKTYVNIEFWENNVLQKHVQLEW